MNMDQEQIKLREKLKKAKFEINKRERPVIALLLKHKYGLYAAEIARELRLYDAIARKFLKSLKEKGLLEFKEAECLDSQNIAHGHKLRIPEGCKVISSGGAEVPFAKERFVKISETDIVIDHEGFRMPFRRGPGIQKSVMFKIKKDLFEILSQK